MPIRKISFRDFTGGIWIKGPIENTPMGALRRMQGCMSPRGGSILSRSGGTAYYPNTDAHSLTTFNGRIVVGSGTTLQQQSFNVTGSLLPVAGLPTLSGNRLDFMEVPVQFLSTNPNQNPVFGLTIRDYLFVADGATPVKISSGFASSFWGIAAPTPAVVNALTATVATTNFTDATSTPPGGQPAVTVFSFDTIGDFQTGGASGFTASADNVRKVTGIPGDGHNALRLRAPKDSETIATHSFSPAGYTPLDLTRFFSGPGTPGPPNVLSTDEDYIQFYVQVARPAHVKSINVKFFVGNSTDGPAGNGSFDQTQFSADPDADIQTPPAPYAHYYSVELAVQTVKKKRRKNLVALGDFLPDNKEEIRKFLREHPQGVGPDLDMQQFLHDLTIAVSRNTWTKVTIPKGLFDRAGMAGQPGRTWANVVGFQVSVESTTDGKCIAWFDDMSLQGGVGTRGDYWWTITYRNDTTGSRSNPPTTTDVNGNTLPVMFGGITLDRQPAALAGFPAALVGASFDDGRADPQVSHIEVWRTIGNGSPGKPNAPFISPSSLTFFLDQKIAVGTITATDSKGDYPGMHSLSSATFLDPNQELTFDNAPPPRTVVSPVFHPPSGRVWALDTANPQRILYSAPGRPESLGSVGFSEPTGPDDPVRRLVVWNDLVFAFTRDHILEMQGQDEPFQWQHVQGAPGCGAYDRTPQASPYGIFYVSPQGPRVFDGAQSRPIADDALAPIFRGSSVENLIRIGTPLLGTYGRNEYALTDVQSQTLIYDTESDSWRSLGFPVHALYYAPALTTPTKLYASFQGPGQGAVAVNTIDGDTTGGVELGGEPGELTTDCGGGQMAADFDVRTPAVFLGGENVGNVQMVYIEADTQGQPVTPTLTVDGTAFVLSPMTTTGKTRVEYNINLPGSVVDLRLLALAANITKRMEISSIEIQIYEPSGES